MDVVLTIGQATRRNDPLDRLLALWAVMWHGEAIRPHWQWGWRRPHLPYVHACADGLKEWPGTPYPHVIWNVSSWKDNVEEHEYAAAAIPFLAELGVRVVFQARADRGGPVTTGVVEKHGLQNVVLVPPEQPDGVGGAKWDHLAGTQVAYLVSVPSLGMLSIEQALARGIPVVAAPAGRWAEWFTAPAQLPAYRADPGLYAQARRQAYSTFCDDRVVGQFELALSLARALRARRSVL